MKGKQKREKGKYWLFFVLNIFLLIGIWYEFNSNSHLLKVIAQKPIDIEVVNVSTTDAWIYWKAPKEGLHTLLFKEVSDIGEFEEVNNIGISTDLVDDKRVFYSNIQDLKPDTLYAFQIKSEDKVWDVTDSFRTKEISEEIQLPEVVSGNGDVMSLLLVDMGDEKLMIDTQYHGTYAFDSKGKEYKATRYSTYFSQEELKEKLALILNSPVYGATGANCKVGIDVNTSGFVPSKSKVIDIIDRWVGGCLLGGYPETCYEDVYCKGLSLGVDPAFLITIWAHESGGSNYAYQPIVEDFGIHGLSPVPVANFTKQIEHFINTQAQPSYISSCTWAGPNPTTFSKELIMWGARYWKGQCSSEESLAYGKQYVEGINQVYGWFTNKTLEWPLTRTKDTSTCSYTTAQTNTAYNSCTQKGTQIPNPDPEPPDGKKTVINMEMSTIDKQCLDQDGCWCRYGPDFVSGQDRPMLAPNYKQICTTDYKVIDPDPNPDPEPDPDPDPDPDPEPDPGVTCTGPDNKPGKEDILVGQVCEDVGGCECFKGSIKTENYFKDVSCGIKCTEENPDPEPLPPICCLKDQSVSWITPTQCSGEVLEGVSKYDCSLKEVNIEIKRNVSFYQALKIVNSNEVPINSAKELIEYSEGKILVVGEFLNNEWVKLVKYNNGDISGQDFNLELGKAYLIISAEEFEIPITSISLPFKEIDLTNLLGWNLVPSGYFDGIAQYTTDILTDQDFEYISQVAVWDDELSSFNYTIEDLDVPEGTDEMFGTYHDISTQQGIFVRISQ